ncbi:MAG: signal recognition particle-docking protein FtsY [Pseudomonas sp.]|uniref:signal recognition particle-docking protein FtsY n=1 Tax=Pseudomonas sp. TaxID=306 RepID=UPI0027235D5E|nr:signal recognition particle-docking protein FtsY [Pseudomonas sp.]MDO9619654.1 signal recognition particle-docking protein FtsY [Pseudomonas sp.]MDP2444461.1 signal recognition particle-docking protein FtsY [Pseudomonas sp.]MDZ4333886.1 signal recognition particle-docking protein FtsY [Pseudomonas sp.]
MFGSNDDKNTPAPSAPASAEKPAEKKDLFGWLRKKPQAPTSPEPQPTPVSEQPVVTVAPATEPAEPAAAPVAPVSEVAAPVVEPVITAEVVAAPQPAPAVPGPVEQAAAAMPAPVDASEANPQPRPSRFRINAGSEVLHAHIEQPALVEPVVVPPVAEPAVVQPVAAPVKSAEETRAGFLERLKQGLSKTSASLGEGMASLFLGKKAIDDDLLEDLETRLLTADVGVEATTAIIGNLTKRVARKELADSGALYKALQDELVALLKPVEQPLQIDSSKQPYVILVVGVNGAGKTTTIGKLAKKLQQDGKKVMLAAGDTFRAAAVEQLQVWGERNQIAVIAQHTGADSASVIFDAVQAAKARGMDVLIADTAGRLHTKDNLMEELKKVRRVIGKLDDTAPHEVLLVLDAGTGQNAINQAKQFNQTVNLTGLALTKLDGTAKGGVIFALAKQFALPIRYIGVGEGIDDLRTFEAEAFVQALFAEK